MPDEKVEESGLGEDLAPPGKSRRATVQYSRHVDDTADVEDDEDSESGADEVDEDSDDSDG